MTALIGVWSGLYLGFLTNWPVTFFIAAIEFLFISWHCGTITEQTKQLKKDSQHKPY
ncbi:Mn2+/Zn2+ ABC transporter permease [Lacticaseibacillus paracasei subsp. paracasei CNCM I-4648]|nr:Mn2+/Zn2+ ABC transporter permease [Lacticaseibacillus paracasei subsp. paracasei CNCM I-4648]